MCTACKMYATDTAMIASNQMWHTGITRLYVAHPVCVCVCVCVINVASGRRGRIQRRAAGVRGHTRCGLSVTVR